MGKTRNLISLFGLVASLSTGFTGLAKADGINVQTVIPSTSTRFVLTEDAMFSKKACCGFRAGLNYIFLNDPLVVVNTTRNSQEQVVLDHIHTADLFGAVQLRHNLLIGLAAPFHFSRPVGGSERYSFGDLRLFAKHRFTADDFPVALAIMPEMRFPTGFEGHFTSDDSYGLGFRLAGEKDLRYVVIAAHVGYWHFGNSRYSTLSMLNRIPVGVGAYVPFSLSSSEWGANIEFNSQPILSSDNTLNPSQLYGGLRYQPIQELSLTAGASVGKLGGPTGADYSIQGGLRWSMTRCKDQPSALAPVVRPTPAPTPAPPRVRLTEKAIEINGEVQFKEGKDVLTDSGKSLLDEIAGVIKPNLRSFKRIHVEGHTNRNGKAAFNMALSKRRATAVKAYLVTRGVPASLMTTEGFGFTRPKDIPGLSKQQHLEVDRRVEFKVER